MAPSSDSIIDKIERQAEQKGIELDTVNEVESDGDGTTFRVLEQDAPNEVDQVGFEITHPEGPLSRNMFDTQLRKYLESLQSTISGSDTDDDEETSEPTDADKALTADAESDPTESHIDNGVSETTSDRNVRVEPDIAIEAVLSIDEDSLTEVEQELSATIDDELGDVNDIIELADRVDELDERLSKIEDGLSTLT
jgi:hypothetical protein